MPVAREITERLDEWFLHTRERLGRDVTDISTEAHMALKTMEENGGVINEEPGRDLVEDVQFQTNNRTTILTRNTPTAEPNLAPIEGKTQAQYQPIMLVTHAFLEKFKLDNCPDENGLMSLTKWVYDNLDTNLNTQMVSIFWNGYVDGDVCLPGLNRFIQFDPSADPDGIAIGGLPVADYPTWQNQVANYNHAYVDFSGGARIKTFLNNGDNSLRALYKRMTNNPDRENKKGRPNFFFMNDPADNMMAELCEQKLIFRDAKAEEELGRTTYRYMDAKLIFDYDVPDDPNNADYGVLIGVNTSVLRWAWYNGLKKKWDGLTKTKKPLGYVAEETTQCAMSCSDRRRLGVQFGLIPL